MKKTVFVEAPGSIGKEIDTYTKVRKTEQCLPECRRGNDPPHVWEVIIHAQCV